MPRRNKLASPKPTFFVEDMCGGRVIIEGYGPNDDGAKRIVDRYSSLEAMVAYLAQAKADDYFLLFQSGPQVLFFSNPRVAFVQQNTSATMATDTLSRLIKVCMPFLGERR